MATGATRGTGTTRGTGRPRGFDLQTWLDGPVRTRLERVTRRRSPGLPAPQVLVEAPGHRARLEHGDLALPFHTASVGKVFLATLVGRSVERGTFTLDTPVGELLPTDVLADLPAAPGVEVARDVTVEHLLSHRAGLPDPFLPPRGHRTDVSLKSLARDPERVVTPRGLVAQAAHLPAQGAPGERFHYTDAGFALLLLIVESVGGAPAADQLCGDVFEPAGMRHTRVVTAPDEIDRMAPLWLGGSEVSRTPALSVGSVDGGAVTTAADLVAFQRALHGGRFISSGLLGRLSRPRSRMRPGIHYGAGLVTLRFDGFMPVALRGLPRPVGGLGLSAVHAFYYPDQDAHVILNFHSTKAMRQSFQAHIQIARGLARLGAQRAAPV